VVLQLIQNLALLAVLSVALQPLSQRLAGRRLAYGLITGALFGVVGVIGMMTPVQFTAGVIYDGRSVVLTVAGLFGGPLTASVAAVVCGGYRLALGGAGALVGTGVILEAALIGSLLYRLRQRDEAWVGPLRLLAAGLVVHVLMLALQLLLPGGTGAEAVREVGPVVLVLFPVAFLLIAQMFLFAERGRQWRESLREREALQAAMVTCSPVALYTIDLDGRVQIWNESAERVFGWAADEVVGEPLPIVPADRQHEYRELREALSRGERFVAREVVRLRRDGTLFHGSLSTAPVKDADGRVVAIMGAMEDITPRKEAAAEHERLAAQLQQAQKMEAVGQLAGGIAHDFNNLLQVISGYGELARAEAPADTPLAASLEQIGRAADRAATLVAQLLAFSRRQVLQMQPVALEDVVADVASMIRRVIGAHIQLEITAGRDLGIVRADPGQLGQILMNLCINARDAMPEGGRLSIEMENVRIDADYCRTHQWAQPGRYVLLSVTDTGCGMDAATRDRIFEPFFTTKSAGEGTGLGLSTVYGLVKQHAGLVHVYSEPGRGSTFKVYLPVIERRAAAVGDKIVAVPRGGDETVLVAEDDAMVRGLAETILASAGYTVLTAQDGAEAAAVFHRHADQVDLAILDVVMPGLGGRAVAEELRARRPDVRILYTSGYSLDAVHTNFELHDDVTLLQKPFSHGELLHKVRAVLDA
jgi:PAS domain S-box-containing protein